MMILPWICLSLAAGCLLSIAIDNEFPGKYNLAVLLTVMVLWPVLLVALLFAPKQRRDKWTGKQ